MSILQSLAAAFKSGAPRVPLARTYSSPWIFADCGGAKAPFEYQGAVRRAYLDNPVAQRAVRLVAEGIGGAALLATDPLLERLVRATTAGQPLLETLASQLLLHGNAYVQVLKDGAGRPVELFALRPERMTAVIGADGWPEAFAYRVGEQVLTIPLLDADASPNLIHIRSFHPADDHYGAGCLAAADQAIAIHNAAANWNRALLENAARPSGALVYDAGGEAGGLTTEQFDRLRNELAQAFSGETNAGRPMLLEGGLKWQSLIGRRCELPTGYLLRTGTWPDADAWAQRHSFLPVGGPARPGDVLLMSPGPGQLHLAVVSPDPAMIVEAHALLRKVVLGPAPSPATVLRHWRLIPSL